MPDFSKYGISFDLLSGFFVVALILFILWTLNKPPAPPLTNDRLIGKVRYVVDGDSLYISSHKPQIRLWGVDAPENSNAGYANATNTLKSFSLNKIITCQVIEIDHYGRSICRCYLKDGQEINTLMIQSGAAKEYRRFTKGFYSR